MADIDDEFDVQATLPADWARTMEARWSVQGVTLQLANHTIQPSPITHDSRGQSAIGRLGTRDVSDGLEIDRTIGEGGMGIVRLATQQSLGRKVAVKTLRPPDSSAEKDPRRAVTQARLRLLREAWMTGAIEHPNVIPIYDLGLDADRSPIIVMKHIEGKTWDSIMGDLTAMRALLSHRDLLECNLRILIQVCQAVAAAHARGVIHRDLKPENVMIGPHGEVYVLDWGIALSVVDDATGRFPLARDASEMAGTPAYMAPEMLGGGKARPDERTDVYLLGAILHHIVYGRAPHDYPDFNQVVASILRSEPPSRVGDVPDELASIVACAMHRSQAARHASVDALRNALEAFLLHRDSLALTDEALDREAELERVIQNAGDVLVERSRLHGLFGACRFGFKEALRTWPENPQAKRGLVRAAERMIKVELAAKSASTAEAILADIPEPPAALALAVAEAKAHEEKERARLAAIEKQVDFDAGGRTRTVVGLMLATSWSVFPLVAWRLEATFGTSHLKLVGGVLTQMLLLGVIFAWARDSLTKTGVNRQLVLAVLILFTAMLPVIAACSILGIPADQTLIVCIGIWLAVTMQQMVALGWQLAPTAVANVLMLFTSAVWPELRYLWISLGNVVLFLNLFIVGRDRLRRADGRFPTPWRRKPGGKWTDP